MAKATGPLYRVKFRRTREGATDYASRLALLKGGSLRAVIRKAGRTITVQFVKFNTKGDIAVAGASSKQLTEFGFTPKSNTPTAYLTGLLAGRRVASVSKQAVADLGRQTSTPGGVIYAAIAGINDSGVLVPVDKRMLPDAKRMSGQHLKSASGFEAAKQKILSSPASKEEKH